MFQCHSDCKYVRPPPLTISLSMGAATDAKSFSFPVQVYQHRPRAAILTPSFVSLPSRIKFDLDQAIEVADTLDVYRFTDKDLQVPDIEEDIYGTYGLKAILAAPEV